MRPAVFLDRDDTIVACRGVSPLGDLGDPELVRLMPRVDTACERLRLAGFALVVVSNQGGVARGHYGEDSVHAVNAEINRRLSGLIERFYFCPYHPNGTVPRYSREHPWRKPQAGMLLTAADDLNIDLSASWMIGDQPRDCAAGRTAGCRTILLGPLPVGEEASWVDFIALDLPAAVDIILGPLAPERPDQSSVETSS